MTVGQAVCNTSPVPRPGMLPPTLKESGVTLQVDPESVEDMLHVIVRQVGSLNGLNDVHLPVVGIP